MADRITPYVRGSSTKIRIDEILIEQAGTVHIEQTSASSAFMQIGERRFWIEARRLGQLYIREEA